MDAKAGENTLFPISSVDTGSQTPRVRIYRAPIYRVELVRESTVKAPTAPIRQSEDIYRLLRQDMAGLDREHFVVLMLNIRNRLIGINTVSIGTLTAALVHPREVYKPAILANAAAVAVAHNHPSGDPAPSPEDLEITKRLKQAGELLAIRFLDHVVIGQDKYFSFTDRGLL